MPNHVTNIVRFEGNISDDLWAHICTVLKGNDPDRSYGSIDFNVLIPMPKELDITDGSNGDNGREAYERFLRSVGDTSNLTPNAVSRLEAEAKAAFGDDDGWELGKKYHNNIEKYGYKTWYGWSYAHWGTKWNAYDCSHNDWAHEFTFLTAWSAPDPVVQKMSELFPGITITHKWADENVGYNVGMREYISGEVSVEDDVIEDTVEAYELAAEIMGLDLYEDCGLELGEDGEYHSIWD